jgi:hypothetical protein
MHQIALHSRPISIPLYQPRPNPAQTRNQVLQTATKLDFGHSRGIASQVDQSVSWPEGILVGSDIFRDPDKFREAHSSRRMLARASLKGGNDFLYQLAIRTTGARAVYASLAQSVIRENKPSRIGVVRAIAGSEHCRWVSTPRWRRTSAKVTSIDQRRMNQRRISSGSASRSIQRKA